MSDISELAVISEFVETLESMEIDYAIGGSIASSVYGHVRFTQDADIAVTSFSEKISGFIEKLKKNFYLSEDAIRHAHRQAGSFNVIHLDTAFKIDVFVCRDMPFQKQLFSRRKKLLLDESLKKEFAVVSPEDIILLKLQWYNDGGAVSEKQWNDILGVLKIQGAKLDVIYMQDWAERLSIRPLLENALQQTGEQTRDE